MKREGHLLEKAVAMDNLQRAYYLAQRGKTDRPEVLAFRANLHANLSAVGHDLRTGAYVFGPYRQFRVYDPKERVITVAPFRDRVTHHTLMQVCDASFERYTIFDSYACRKGKGSQRAVMRAQHFSLRFKWFLKLDIARYFDSIDHDILLHRLARRFKERPLLSLFRSLVTSYAVSLGKGLPIGNLSSQYFANHYLGYLDHWVKEARGVRGYVRYMDDFILWHDDKSGLKGLLSAIKTFLSESLALRVKPAVLLNRTAAGVPFLGYRVFPGRLGLTRRSATRFRRKYREYEHLRQRGTWSEATCARHMEALIAFTRLADAKPLRRHLMKHPTIEVDYE